MIVNIIFLQKERKNIYEAFRTTVDQHRKPRFREKRLWECEANLFKLW